MCGIIYESSNDDPTKQNKYTLESNTDSGGRIWQWNKILGTKYRTKRTLKWEKKKDNKWSKIKHQHFHAWLGQE